MSSLDELMQEMAALSGIPPKTSSAPMIRVRAMLEGDGGMAARENLKGRVEVLAKRLEGVVDFIEDGNMQAATIAFTKILKDAESTLEEMGVATDKDSKEKKKEAEAAKAAEKEMKGQQRKQPRQRPGAQDAGSPDSGPQQSPKATPAQSPPQAQQEGLISENVAVVNGEVIAQINDPFGHGQEFKDYIARVSGIKK